MVGFKSTLIAAALIAGTAYAKGEIDETGASVKGSLSKEAIREAIRGHMEEVKQCYEPALEKSPRLGGRILVNFTISAEGKVTDSKIAQSTLGNQVVEACIAKAVRGWEFPKPKGGKVVVTYPFLLKPVEDGK